MTIHWIFIALAALLLLPPLPLSEALRRSIRSPRRNASSTVPAMMNCWQNWADLGRGAAGAYVLTNFGMVADPHVEGGASKAIVSAGIVLCLGLAIQMVRFSRGVHLVAPLFYLSGATIVLAGLIQGGFAVFVGMLFAIGGKRPIYGLPLTGIALCAAGYVLDSTLTSSDVLVCGLIALPLLAAFLSQKPLAFVAPERRLAVPVQEAAKNSKSASASVDTTK